MYNSRPKNTLIENNEFQTVVKNLIEEKYGLLLDQSFQKNSFIEEHQLFESLRSTKFLFNYLNKLNKKNGLERVFVELLYKNLLETEKNAAGSAFFSFFFILNFLLMEKEKVNSFEKELMISLKKEREYLPNYTEFYSFINEWFQYKPKWYKNLYKEVYSLTGLKSFTSMKPSNATELIIEVKNGYRFKGFIPDLFINNVSKTVTLQDLKFVLVDGMIEKASEIFNVLNFAHESKIPIVLIAQKFSDEVYSALAANFIKNKLQVYPFEIETAFDTLNQITDVAIVAGTIPISVLAGDSLITKKISEIPSVESCIIRDGEFIIENKKTTAEVESHIRNLIRRKHEKRSEYQVIEISDYDKLFDMRIERLLGSIVEIQIPNVWSKMKKNEFTSFFDEIFKQLKHYNIYGTASKETMNIISSLPIKTNLLKTNELNFQIIHGLKNALSLVRLLTDSNSLILSID